MKNLIFVDCEATGKSPSTGRLTEFGAVAYPSREVFHGVLVERKPSEENPKIRIATGKTFNEKETFEKFDAWLIKVTNGGKPIFVSDNPAFDWQWINDSFWRTLKRNPFGHSARRISDFYAGLVGDFMDTQSWKKLRITPHDHNPVHDALGNLEAFERLLRGERKNIEEGRKCKKCSGTGQYIYDEHHIKPCEICCKHSDGWWKLEQHYGNDNGKYACKKGCGTVVDNLPAG